ncbi:aminodeoxychorismate synthase component I [Tianweitania populi]|uniref:Aminodeoxychorismate synthase component I n=1 Tax=Tianweitania populi TaxID=1607949 RepID=A0A8J3DUK5_9HYPH|nr:aminodeoxychorismate synthase component I [Tianweitania populi]GHD11457.1 aminodeoxychorismate synthase component I [Tianweitania populi]
MQPFAFFRDDRAGRSVLFEQPRAIIRADTPDDFDRALDQLQEARTQRKWLAGFFSYEAGYLLEPKLRPLLPESRRVPLCLFGVFDHPAERDLALEEAQPTNGPIFDARASWSAKDYRKRFERVHRHLREGDCYQVNLTFPIHAHWSGDPVSAFAALIARQPVKYGALIDLGGPVILSRSPELFFEIDRDGWIETRPMKGTVPRGQTPDEDEKQRHFLVHDPKNRSENRMIVDLLRNDVSLISEVGTLDVPDLFKVETYPTLHTMVSRVRAKLLPNRSVRDIFTALFPCGSITGAPKIRAMEVIRSLETEPRDAYCGAIGWMAPDGTMRFNVAIRTVTLHPTSEAVYNVGGGVVFDSSAQAEYDECLLKARFATGSIPRTA